MSIIDEMWRDSRLAEQLEQTGWATKLRRWVAEVESLTAERDKYKLFYDAIIDHSIVHWTYDREDETNAMRAVEKLVANHIAQVADPQICENTAKLTVRAEAAESKVKAIIEMLEPESEAPCDCIGPTGPECTCRDTHRFIQAADWANNWELWCRACSIAEGRAS